MDVEKALLQNSASYLPRYEDTEGLGIVDPGCSLSASPAETAFQEGIKTFKTILTRDAGKKKFLDNLQARKIQDVLEVVTRAQQRYKSRRSASKVREKLAGFSQRICHYGAVLDVLVQHHPEYVSLAWGAMKLVFGAVVEHENTLTVLTTALCDVADSLPRVQLMSALYPTQAMLDAVALLYAYVIRFLIRAMQWYEAGKLSHALHSIVRPAAIRYSDLIKEIQRITRSIQENAVVGSQAEQREMYNEVREVRATLNRTLVLRQAEYRELRDQLSDLIASVAQVQDVVTLEQSINASARIQLRNAMSDVQLTQALSFVASNCSIDHKSIFRDSLMLRDRQRTTTQSKMSYYASFRELQDWNSSPESSTMLLTGAFKERVGVRDLNTSIIEQLVSSKTAVCWILKDRDKVFSISDILKSLILQALSQDYVSHTDVTFSFQLRKFLDAQFDKDYLNIFADLVCHFGCVYVVIDAGVMSPETTLSCQDILHGLTERLAERDARTVVKVIMSSCGPAQKLSLRHTGETQLKIGNASRRKTRRLQKAQSRTSRKVPPTVVGRGSRPWQIGVD